MEIPGTFMEQFSIASLVSVVVIGGLSFYSLMGETTLSKPRAHRNHLTVGGLINDGNTCFMNSVIQAFCSMKTFQDYITSQEHKGPVTSALQKLIDGIAEF
jgi:ubiquitin C-terminal hydrolase